MHVQAGAVGRAFQGEFAALIALAAGFALELEVHAIDDDLRRLSVCRVGGGEAPAVGTVVLGQRRRARRALAGGQKADGDKAGKSTDC